MGQCISVPHEKLSNMREGSKRCCLYKSKPGNLSATFHVLDSSLRWDLLNVNIATEEQLMTLPGINRTIAENIIEYRQKIGGFKKVEDLALVSGVGATKLELFRTEITVGRRKCNGSSYNSSVTQSIESLPTNEGSTRSSPLRLVNVNTANVFQLMSICRMTQEMAAHIVHYRERKGPFKSVDDLLKVKGLPSDRLAVVKMYLTVDLSSESSRTCVNNKNTENHNHLCVKQLSSHRRTNSAPCGFGKSRSTDMNSRDLYDLVCCQVTRPCLKNRFNSTRNGKPVIRISSWNLENFVLEKAKNPGVREVICRTFLENGLSIIAVQEVSSKEALSLVTSELNDPKLQNVKNWDGSHGKWHSLLPTNSTSSDINLKTLMNGFLYDTSKGLRLLQSTVLYLPPEAYKELEITCQPFLGWFQIDTIEFAVVTFSLLSEICITKLLPSILDVLKEKVQGEKNVFLMGNFVLPPGHTAFEIMTEQGYKHLVPCGTSVNSKPELTDSHLWASSDVKKLFTGESGVITEGLSHILIPNGWEWGGRVSSHAPLWAEIYTNDASPIDENRPLINGVCNLSVDLDASPDKSTEGSCKKEKSLWPGNWVWRYNNRNVTCEKNNSVKENGAV